MQILVIGSGGREHAIAWKIAQSHKVEKVWVAPGNGGTALEKKVENINIKSDDIAALLNFARQQPIDLTVVGPELPLSLGIVDHFLAANLLCFGPKQAAAQLETSKAFCKDFLHRHHIPTANYACFTDQKAALAYLHKQRLPIVIKADGLAAGKGVIIAQTMTEAEQAVAALLKHNQTKAQIVIEEFLAGEELSFIVMSDGEHILPLAGSQDHKRRDDGNLGPNTGGMGAHSPAPILTDELHQQIMTDIIRPTILGMKQDICPYQGFLYAGLMITPAGEPKVLEFNCRLGDPETQPLMLRLQSDFVDLLLAACHGQLNTIKAKWDQRPAVGVVMAAGGYPDTYRKGDIIHGLPHLFERECKIFHSGTLLTNEKIVTNGGRVLTVTCLGKDLPAARQEAYDHLSRISWPDCFYRRDIGLSIS